jgi:hypothetical protein
MSRPAISVCYTSARPNLVPDRIHEWTDRATDPDSLEFVVTIDLALWSSSQSLAALPRTKLFMNRGRPCCVDGWNLAARKARGGILIQCSDDLHPPAGWDAEVRRRLGSADDAHVLAISDGLTAGLAFLPHAVLTRRYYNQFGYLFHDAYWSMWSDNEFSTVAHQRGVVINGLEVRFAHSHGVISDDVRSRHEGPAFHTIGHQVYSFRQQHAFRPWMFNTFITDDTDSDGIYSPNWRARLPSYWTASPRTAQHFLGFHRESLESRKKRFGAAAPLDALQVLILAAPGDGELVDVLGAELTRQGLSFLIDDQFDADTRKRQQQLIIRATAPYVTVVEGHDWVSHNYGELIADAIANNGGKVDMILHDVVTTAGDQAPKPSFVSLDHGNAELPECNLRTPNHSMIWRREIALKEAFAADRDREEGERLERLRHGRWARVHGLLRFQETPVAP